MSTERIHVLKCPACGAPLDFNIGALATKCDYCGSKVVAPRPYQADTGLRARAQPSAPTDKPLWGKLSPLERLEAATDFVRISGFASASTLQLHFRIAYPDAAWLLEYLEKFGIIGPTVVGSSRRWITDYDPSVSAAETIANAIQQQQARSVEGDPLLNEAIDLVRREGRASVSMLQRRMRIGYTRAARLVDVMEERGIVAPPDANTQVRQVLDYGPAAPPADQ